MGVVRLKGPLPWGALGVVVVYCPQRDKKGTAFQPFI
jgi:hypothetical protein